jgi:hypothetical protein
MTCWGPSGLKSHSRSVNSPHPPAGPILTPPMPPTVCLQVQEWLDFVVGRSVVPPGALRRDRPPERSRRAAGKKRRAAGATTEEELEDLAAYNMSTGGRVSHSPQCWWGWCGGLNGKVCMVGASGSQGLCAGCCFLVAQPSLCSGQVRCSCQLRFLPPEACWHRPHMHVDCASTASS